MVGKLRSKPKSLWGQCCTALPHRLHLVAAHLLWTLNYPLSTRSDTDWLKTLRLDDHSDYAWLDAQNDSKTIKSKFSTVVEMVCVEYKSLYASLIKHIGQISGLVNQLANMGALVKGTLATKMLVVSVKAPQLSPVTA